MAKPHDLKISDWNAMVDFFKEESDRGAAVLVGGFVENFLGVFLKSFFVDPKIGNELFGAMGALSTFSQRIALARAFGFISQRSYDDLNLIRQIRNHFAHHPLDTSFDSPEIAKLTAKLVIPVPLPEEQSMAAKWDNRHKYTYACAAFCGRATTQMEALAETRGALKPHRVFRPEGA